MKHLYFLPKGHPRIMYKALKWSSLQRYGATVAFTSLLVFLWWLLHLRPLNRRLLLKQEALNIAQEERQEASRLQEEISSLENKLKELEQAFISKSPASFVAEWSLCAQQAGLFLISVHTRDPIYNFMQKSAHETQASETHNELNSSEVEPQGDTSQRFVLVEFIVQGNFDALHDLTRRLQALSFYAQLEKYSIDRYHDDILSCTFMYKFYL